jgi:hypothetical protein
MPRSESPPSYGHYRAEVEGMLAIGRPLGAVERMLKRAPIEADQRSALWLLAWATHDHLDQAESVVLTPLEGGDPIPARARMSTADHSRNRLPGDRERDIRRTRTEGARRAIRARQAQDVRDDAWSFGRPRELGQRRFPGRSRVVRFTERVGRLSRSGPDGPTAHD